jgi:hypothetical protein
MSLFSSKMSIEDIKNQKIESLDRMIEKSFAEEFSHYLPKIQIALICTAVVSIASGIAFVNYSYNGNANLIQAATFLSLIPLVFLELGKSFFYDKTFLNFYKEKLVCNDPKNSIRTEVKAGDGSTTVQFAMPSIDYTKILKFSFVSILLFCGSFWISVHGINLFFEQKNDDFLLQSNATEGFFDLDSVKKIFEKRLADKRDLANKEISFLENKIENLKYKGGVWSSDADATAKIKVALNEDISKMRDRFADFEREILKEQTSAVEKVILLNEDIANAKIQKVQKHNTESGGNLAFITIFLEFLSIALNLSKNIIDYNISLEARVNQKEIATVAEPILIEINPISHEVATLRKTVYQLLELQRSQGQIFISDSTATTQGNKIGYHQNSNPTNQLHGTGCRNESEFINRFGGLISDLKENKADFRTLMENHRANTIQVDYAKAYIQRNMQ